MNDIAISVKNLSKKYHLYDSPQHRLKEALHPFRKKYHHDFWALRDVSFEVKKGESIGIIGKNGSGKSTLLQLICGVLQPSEGGVIVDGRISALLELGAGFNPELTGRENVYMNGAIMGFNREDMDERYDAIVGFADIGEFIDQPVKIYSSGMFVRLAFACAVNVDPEILIVDEALAVGDLNFSQKCMDYMLKLFNEKTVVLVSHNLADIKRLCKRVVVLDKGIVQHVGLPDQAIIKYYSISEKEQESKPKIKGGEEIVETLRAATEMPHILLKSIRCFLIDEKNKRIETGEVEFSKPFEIDLEYEINAKLNRPEFRISFNTIDKRMVVCSSSSTTTLKGAVNFRGVYNVGFRFPRPLLYPREYFINIAIRDNASGLYYYSQVDIFRFNVLYPTVPVFEDMEVGTGITHMEREFYFKPNISTNGKSE